MILGVLLRVEQAIAVDRVQLQLMPAALHEQLDEPRDFLRSLIVAEEGVVKFEGERTAVADPLQMRFGERVNHGEHALEFDIEGGGIIGAERLPRLPPVGVAPRFSENQI